MGPVLGRDGFAVLLQPNLVDLVLGDRPVNSRVPGGTSVRDTNPIVDEAPHRPVRCDVEWGLSGLEMPARGGLDREDCGVGILDEDTVLKVRVRRMHGRLCAAGVEVLKIVPGPRRRGRRRAFERDVRPVRNFGGWRSDSRRTAGGAFLG